MNTSWNEDCRISIKLHYAYIYCDVIVVTESIIFRSINFCNRGINRSHEVTYDGGMLLFPFGNLSHTSILYYTTLYAVAVYE
jgi:hypothetical protein